MSIPEKVRQEMMKGEVLSKHDLAKLVHCHHKNAGRALTALYRLGVIYVVKWERNNCVALPFFQWRTSEKQQDALYPATRTGAEKAAERRKRKEVREKEAAVKRWDRSVGKHVTLGVWGL
jgi:hypothetical protein